MQNSRHQSLAENIMARRHELAQRVIEYSEQHYPNLIKVYGDKGIDKCRQDTAYHLLYLSQALQGSSRKIFRDYVIWIKALLNGLGINDADLVKNLIVLKKILQQELNSNGVEIVVEYIDTVLDQYEELPVELPSFITPDNPLNQLARDYLDDLLHAHRDRASNRILDAVKQNVEICDLYLHVFQCVQREIGRLWQLSQVTVAQEHYCTAATQLIMSQLYAYVFGAERCGMSMVGTCVGGEMHEIGVRMIADFFEMEGWDSYYLGANVPAASIISTLLQQRADVLAISVTFAGQLAEATELIRNVRRTPGCEETRILIGGYPFNVDKEMWRQLGADASGRNAREAVHNARNLFV